jgi:hypothetical protein
MSEIYIDKQDVFWKLLEPPKVPNETMFPGYYGDGIGYGIAVVECFG